MFPVEKTGNCLVFVIQVHRGVLLLLTHHLCSVKHSTNPQNTVVEKVLDKSTKNIILILLMLTDVLSVKTKI